MNNKSNELPGGWFSPDDISVYRDLVSQIPRNGKMIELGVWKGRSICSVSDLLIENNISVICVDTFEGTGNEGINHKEAKEADLYTETLENLTKFNILDRVEVLKMTTDEAVSKIDSESIDFIFIDADHCTDAVCNDIKNYIPKLKKSGRLAGHDAWWKSVMEGISRAGIIVNTLGNIWFVGDLVKNNKFSVCLIGKNEEKTLPRALESLALFLKRGGEVCYLDTGSTDKSVKIAKSFGCKTLEVGDMFIDHITEDQEKEINKRFITEGEEPVVKKGDKLFRFGDARNYCAENLATNDMVAWFDCDEVTSVMDIDKIESFIAQGNDQFEYNFVFAHDQWGGEALKFVQSKFYNKKKLKWTGIIHEVLSGAGRRRFLDESVYKLEHWQNHETNRGGYLKGLALDCWQHQDQDRQSHYFARELLWNGRPKSAIKEFLRHLTISWWKAERAQSMIFIAEANLMLGNETEAVEWFLKGYEEDGDRREALIKLAEYHFRKRNYRKVCVYCMAALEIPWNGFYAASKQHYENRPHELLAEAKWHLGDRTASKYHFDKALEYTPLSSKLLYEYRYHNYLPKISFLLPTLGRPEGAERCIKSIKELNYPQEQIEILSIEDEPRIGVPKRVKELFEKSTGEYVVYAANDMEFEKDCIIHAYIEMQKNNKMLCAFDDGEMILPDEGNICTHFMIKRDLVEKIGGEIFSTKFNHCGVDNLLWAKAQKLEQGFRSNRAKIKHYHFSTGKSSMDDTYKTGWAKVDEDREILKKELESLK